MSGKSKRGRRNRPDDRVFRLTMSKKREEKALQEAQDLVNEGWERLAWDVEPDTAREMKVELRKRKTKGAWHNPEKYGTSWELWIRSSDAAAVRTMTELRREEERKIWSWRDLFNRSIRWSDYSQTEMRTWAMMTDTYKPSKK